MSEITVEWIAMLLFLVLFAGAVLGEIFSHVDPGAAAGVSALEKRSVKATLQSDARVGDESVVQGGRGEPG